MKYCFRVFLSCFLVFLIAQKAVSQTEFGPKTPQEIAAFLDSWFEENMPKTATPGASFVFVKDGQVFFNKGYGHINTTDKVQTQSDSVFRIASVSKIFVGIAAAQLVEEGKLDLDVNITEYIGDFPFQKPGFGAITMRHLLAHTSGLDEQFYGDSTLDPKSRQSLEEHLKQTLPQQVRAPDELYAYSNYGYTLAGYVIEKITKIPFNDYVTNNILSPLGMEHSGYILNDKIREKLATGYRGDQGAQQPAPYTYVHRYPPTSMMTSANDMAKFMIAVLGGGTFENQKIYSDTAKKLLEEPLHSTTSPTSGYSSGFQLSDRWGHRIIWHDGTHFGFNSYIMLFPDLGMGFFAASNHHDGNLIGDLRFDLLDRFFKPTVIEGPQEPYRAYSNHQSLEGTYINSRRVHKSLAKINDLFSSPLKITVNANNTINIYGRPYAEVEKDLFERIGLGSRRMKVYRSEDGTVSHIAYDVNDSPATFERQAWHETSDTHGLVFIILLLLFILSLPYRWFLNRRKDSKVPFLTIIPTLLNLGFMIAFITFFAVLDLLDLRTGNLPTLWGILTIPIISLIVMGASIYKVLTGPEIKGLTPHQKAFWLCGILLQSIFLIELNYWNLLGYFMTS